MIKELIRVASKCILRKPTEKDLADLFVQLSGGSDGGPSDHLLDSILSKMKTNTDKKYSDRIKKIGREFYGSSQKASIRSSPDVLRQLIKFESRLLLHWSRVDAQDLLKFQTHQYIPEIQVRLRSRDPRWIEWASYWFSIFPALLAIDFKDGNQAHFAQLLEDALVLIVLVLENDQFVAFQDFLEKWENIISEPFGGSDGTTFGAEFFQFNKEAVGRFVSGMAKIYLIIITESLDKQTAKLRFINFSTLTRLMRPYIYAAGMANQGVALINEEYKAAMLVPEVLEDAYFDIRKHLEELVKKEKSGELAQLIVSIFDGFKRFGFPFRIWSDMLMVFVDVFRKAPDNKILPDLLQAVCLMFKWVLESPNVFLIDYPICYFAFGIFLYRSAPKCYQLYKSCFKEMADKLASQNRAPIREMTWSLLQSKIFSGSVNTRAEFEGIWQKLFD